VDRYVADEACGFGLNPAGTGGMIEGAMLTGQPERIDAIRKDLPILIASGDADPLAAGGDLIRLLESRYRDAGLTDVTVELYPEARHEILNETNRDEVTGDILAFLDRTIGR
jgi:alpha-beta hydrolase superfamily lysophospholipase